MNEPAGSAGSAGPAAAVRRRVFLVRHGETEWSRSGQHTSVTDLPLTERGEAEATALRPMLADWLAGRPLALALTSPLQRARRTAELVGIRTTVEPDLVELRYGDYEGRTTADISGSEPGWSVWTCPLSGGETLAEAAKRVDRVLDRVRLSLGQGDVVLFAHGHILRILAARWLGLDAAGGRYFALGTAALSVLGTEHGNPVILNWNLPNPAAG